MAHERLCLAADTGGTFTDLVVVEGAGRGRLFKAATTPDDPIRGLLDVVDVAARHSGSSRSALLGRADVFVYGTTRAINAILTGETARTALMTTQGHRDVLVFREGGRVNPFDRTQPYPTPYVPRSLTFEVPERISAGGQVLKSLDLDATASVIREMARRGVKAVAVCLLWSIVNPDHELRVAELLDQQLPGIPYTLSHRLNPTIREFRRASSTAIDASLKPLMSGHLARLEQSLTDSGFGGRLLVVTSAGGVLDAGTVAQAPIHSINSGPSMAPVAGRHYADVEQLGPDLIVTDTGGTSYDVSLVRRGRISTTSASWIGAKYTGHMTGLPSVDVSSIGQGGGSIAWLDAGGLLHVGPDSAGSHPGPVAYGRGGTRPTVTDAALVLGYLDAAYFLGGKLTLDHAAATRAIRREIADPLGMSVMPAAAAILDLTTRHMVEAIESMTLYQGIDPRAATIVAGGGAAGLNSVALAKRLGCAQVLFPSAGAGLSAMGALLGDLSAEFSAMKFTTTRAFDFGAVGATLAALTASCRDFVATAGAHTLRSVIELSVEARYPEQVWQLDVPLVAPPETSADVERLRTDFCEIHERHFTYNDPNSAVECVSWRARVRCELPVPRYPRVEIDPAPADLDRSRMAYFDELGLVDVPVLPLAATHAHDEILGPAIIESPVTTIVVPPEASAHIADSGGVAVTLPARTTALLRAEEAQR